MCKGSLEDTKIVTGLPASQTWGGKYYAWFLASAATEMRTALFWVNRQRVVIISYRSFGTTYRSHLQGSRGILDPGRWGLSSDKFLPTFRDNLLVSSSKVKRDSWSLKMRNFLPKFRATYRSHLQGSWMTLVPWRYDRNVGTKLPLLAA
jgi:hypothetical protein